ncbi:MAG: hypothetical protein ACTSV2_08105 [Candidatus Thorarchaeota archaeon]
MTDGSKEYEDIIRVIEGEAGSSTRLCHVRIFKNPDDKPRPVIELPERKEQQYYVYDVVKCFDNVQDAHDYAEKNGIMDTEY